MKPSEIGSGIGRASVYRGLGASADGDQQEAA